MTTYTTEDPPLLLGHIYRIGAFQGWYWIDSSAPIGSFSSGSETVHQGPGLWDKLCDEAGIPKGPIKDLDR